MSFSFCRDIFIDKRTTTCQFGFTTTWTTNSVPCGCGAPRFFFFRRLCHFFSPRACCLFPMGGVCSRDPDKKPGLLSNAAEKQANFSFRYHRHKDVLADYIIHPEQVLGTGANGEVILVTARDGFTQCALKRFQRQVSKKDMEALVREAEIFLNVDHPHIARLLDIYETKTDVSLVMEYCSGGEVFTRLKDKGAYKESHARNLAHQMFLAVNYLHSKGLAHRDLKLENFLYDGTGEDAKIKLIDFGFSCLVKYKMNQACGSLSYVAPEVLGTTGYDKQCDMWSLGVIVFLLLSGYSPFQGGPRQQVMRRIMSGKYIMRVERWEHISRPGREFVAGLLEVDPKTRLTCAQALNHPWMIKSMNDGEDTVVDEAVLCSLQNYADNSRFKRMCLNMLAWSLSTKERDEVMNVFKKMDKAEEGWITLIEFKEAMRENFNIDDQEISRMFNALDLNSDDNVYYSDFVGAMVAQKIIYREEEVRKTFRRFDKDNSGEISRANLVEALGADASSKEINELMEAMDTDHNGKISLSEFMTYIASTNPNRYGNKIGFDALRSAEHRGSVTESRETQKSSSSTGSTNRGLLGDFVSKPSMKSKTPPHSSPENSREVHSGGLLASELNGSDKDRI